MIFGFGAEEGDAVPGIPGAIVGPASRITPEMVIAAKKWAAYYQMPPAWVLATIIAESGGNPKVVGDYHVDPRGASIGLMQVNTVAEAANLRRAKVTREMLFQPAINIQWGTAILRRKYDQVLLALSTARNKSVSNAISHKPALLGELVRLLYTGVDVIKHIYRGTLPDAKKVAPTVGGWRRNLVAVAPLAPESVAAAPASSAMLGKPMHHGRIPRTQHFSPRMSHFYPRGVITTVAVPVASGDDCATYPNPIECPGGVVYWKTPTRLCCRSY